MGTSVRNAVGKLLSGRPRFEIRSLLAVLVIAVVASVALPAPPPRGLVGRYWDNPEWRGNPIRVATATAFTVPAIRAVLPGSAVQAFSAEWTGFIFVDRPGRYTFHVESDDGSFLYIDESPTQGPVVNNGGIHGRQVATGSIELSRGAHRIRLRYFQAGGDLALFATWTPPGDKQTPLPANLLSPDAASAISPTNLGLRIITASALTGAWVGLLLYVPAQILGAWLRRNPRLRAEWLALAILVVVTLVLPLGLRLVNLAIPGVATPSYLPSVLLPRPRLPFETKAIDDLRKAAPGYVIIGDSMTSRIDLRRLDELVQGRGVKQILYPASGSAFWYLVFKNWVIPSGIKPRAVIFFFRDENLTEPLWRADFGGLDRAALEREPVLNDLMAARSNGTWFRVHAWLTETYQFDRTRAWLEPKIAMAPVTLAADRRSRQRLLDRMNDEIFTLAALRRMAAADMAAGLDSAFNFPKYLPTSVLPEIFRLAKASGVRVAFIRVQRRPVNNKPPVQSPALQRYVRELGQYLVANGAYFHDDWGDPAQPLSIYGDGDHIGNDFGRYSTELFFRNNPELFR